MSPDDFTPTEFKALCDLLARRTRMDGPVPLRLDDLKDEDGNPISLLAAIERANRILDALGEPSAACN